MIKLNASSQNSSKTYINEAENIGFDREIYLKEDIYL